MRMAVMHVEKWMLRPDGGLEAQFSDNLGMKIITSPVEGIDGTNTVWTESGCAYTLGEPIYDDKWPGTILARTINETFYSAVRHYYHRNIQGNTLWEFFQDELSFLFVGSR